MNLHKIAANLVRKISIEEAKVAESDISERIEEDEKKLEALGLPTYYFEEEKGSHVLPKVEVLRSNGNWDPGWSIYRILHGYITVVKSKNEKGGPPYIQKKVNPDEIRLDTKAKDYKKEEDIAKIEEENNKLIKKLGLPTKFDGVKSRAAYPNYTVKNKDNKWEPDWSIVKINNGLITVKKVINKVPVVITVTPDRVTDKYLPSISKS